MYMLPLLRRVSEHMILTGGPKRCRRKGDVFAVEGMECVANIQSLKVPLVDKEHHVGKGDS